MTDTQDEKERALRELITVLQLEKHARAATKKDELAFLIVNDSHRIATYEQAVLWAVDVAGNIVIEAVSGVARPDPNSPFLQSLTRIFKSIASMDNAGEIHEVMASNIDQSLGDDLNQSSLFPLWCPFKDTNGSVLGGVWFNSRTRWQQKDIARLEFAIDAYSHSWQALNKTRLSWRKRFYQLSAKLKENKIRTALLFGVLLVMLLPVSQTVTAPAEVVAIKPIILSPPVDGVIKKINIRPNALVKAGQILFSLEDSNIRNKFDVSTKELDVALADYRRASAKSFSDEKTREEVDLLKAVVEQKKVEVLYSKELLQRIEVRATRDGIAVFSDENDWVGKPVRVGQKIITLADPSATELLVWVPVDDAVSLDDNAKVRGFLNVDPTSPIDGKLRQLSYEAQISPDDVLSFKLHAKFNETVTPPRIGLRATAKVYGKQVSLFYYIFRRPFSAIRRFFGW